MGVASLLAVVEDERSHCHEVGVLLPEGHFELLCNRVARAAVGALA